MRLSADRQSNDDLKELVLSLVPKDGSAIGDESSPRRASAPEA